MNVFTESAPKQMVPYTFKNKRGQTVHCDFTGVVYDGLRHRLHRNDATHDCNITVDIFAHRQLGVGWRILFVEQDHDTCKTRAGFTGQQYASLNEILSDAQNIVERTGYL